MDAVPRWRKGRLLVAAPSLTDPNFRRSVVLLLEHSENGALGVILNRPTAIRMHEALPGRLAGSLPDDAVIHEGGPCEPDSVLLLGEFRDEGAHLGGTPVVGSLRVVEPDADLRDMDDQVLGLRAFGGYAGWGGGQLEGEIDDDAWIDAEYRPDDVFSEDPEGLWSAVLERKGGNYRLVARMPLDPSLN